MNIMIMIDVCNIWAWAYGLDKDVVDKKEILKYPIQQS